MNEEQKYIDFEAYERVAEPHKIDIQPSSENVTRLVLAIGKEEMSVKSMMEAVGLKNRPNFMDYSLAPAIREGFVCMKYPANPHHPQPHGNSPYVI